MNPEEHNRIVRAALDNAVRVGHLPKQKDLVDIERLILDAKERIKRVRAHGLEIDAAVKAAGKDHDRKLLWQELQGKYLDELVHYNKDELLVLLSHFLTQMTHKEIV